MSQLTFACYRIAKAAVLQFSIENNIVWDKIATDYYTQATYIYLLNSHSPTSLHLRANAWALAITYIAKISGYDPPTEPCALDLDERELSDWTDCIAV